MSDAPRWPGANGSPGLDFSRKPAAGEDAPSNDALDTDATHKVDVSAVRGKSDTDQALAEKDASEMPNQSRPDFKTTDRKSQNADDWELDSITRGNKPVAAGGAKTETVPALAEGDEVEVPHEGPKPARAAAPSSDPAPAVAPTRGARRTRKARLRINRLDPWSVMKTSFLFSIAFAVMSVAAVSVIWSVFAGSDTLNYLNDLINSVVADPQGGNRFDINEFLSFQRVIGLTTVLAAINVIIFTAVATLFAFLYNLSSVIMGGLEITLAED